VICGAWLWTLEGPFIPKLFEFGPLGMKASANNSSMTSFLVIYFLFVVDGPAPIIPVG